VLAIVDYGMANLRSVQKAFQRLGHAAEIISTPEQVKRADRLVVPGVGAFCDAIAVLNNTGLADAIRSHIATGRPMLGICLGLQLLMDIGYEDGTHSGLGVIPGTCVRFTVDTPPPQNPTATAAGNAPAPLKVPHMGWNALHFQRPAPLFKNLTEGAYVYFVHSYHVIPKDPQTIAATADYGTPFVAALWKDNVMATQFHPEKSQRVGLKILSNFAGFTG